jgi:hypothetical protein
MTTPGSIRNVFLARIPPPHPWIRLLIGSGVNRYAGNTISNIGPCNNHMLLIVCENEKERNISPGET